MGLRILVSPFMMFDVPTKTTDIIMFNSRNLGALIVDEKPHVKSWDEPQYSIQNLGIEESYGFGVLNEGQAIAVAKNVKVRQRRDVDAGGVDHLVRSDDLVFEYPPGSGRWRSLRHQQRQLRPRDCRLRQLITQ